MKPFAPAKTTKNIDVSGSSQSVLVANALDNVRVMNDGTATAWIAFGDSTVTAALASGIPIGPGVTEVLSPITDKGSPVYVAAIAAGATGKIYFTPGIGV